MINVILYEVNFTVISLVEKLSPNFNALIEKHLPARIASYAFFWRHRRKENV